MKVTIGLGVLTIVAAVGCRAAMAADAVDPRTRTYVMPTRVVWTSQLDAKHYGERAKVETPEALTLPRHGQVPEIGWGVKPSGCVLVNSGEKPGVLLDFGREIHGGLQIGVSPGQRGMSARIRFGESVSEAMSGIGEKGATNDHAIRDDVMTLPSFGTREIGNTGFRFVRIDLETNGKVTLEFVRAIELMRPMKRLGFFRCSDERLNRVFDTAVRTVHLCCQDYLWDGIKRDRLVWMGDTHPETMGILTSFGAAPILPESLAYMADITPTDKWMNGIGSYTLWWVRNVAEWYRYTGDREFVARHGEYLRKTFDNLERFVTASNTFEGANFPFLDWPTQHNAPAVRSGLQALALVAWREGTFLADAIGDAALAKRCRATAARFERLRGTLSPHGSKQAAALLALAGLADPAKMYDEVLGRDGVAGVSTFYGYYMLEALSASGHSQQALDTVRDYWGAMLDVGATSFWEDFNVTWTNNAYRIDELPVAGKKDVHGDYGEFCYSGLRHSLCHGWSCGPAPWCIQNVLGIRPLDVGCRRIAVKPFLGDLEWAEGAMALPGGRAVRVSVRKGEGGKLAVKTDAPEGVSVEVMK